MYWYRGTSTGLLIISLNIKRTLGHEKDSIIKIGGGKIVLGQRTGPVNDGINNLIA